MCQYKMIKVRQPFIYSEEYDEYEIFQEELLELLNSGYEIVYRDNFTSDSENRDHETSFKLFILRKIIY